MLIGTRNIDEITSEELQSNMNYYNYLSKFSINKIFQLYNQAIQIYRKNLKQKN